MVDATTDLIWRGTETIHAARAALARQGTVAVQLPADFHHAVYARLHPACRPGDVEALDITGGPELLARISQIPGLDPLVQLERVAAEARARVRVLSPSPKVVITARPESEQRGT